MHRDRATDVGLLGVRLLVGGLFAGHGAQKLFGAFGGPGLEPTAQMMHSVGFRPGRAAAPAAGAAELGGGALLAAGLLTPAGAAATSASMVGAIAGVHAPKGLWNHEGGYEYNLVLIGVGALLSAAGPGALSLDRALGTERRGLRWAAAQLLAAVAGGLGALALGRRLTGDRQGDREGDDDAGPAGSAPPDHETVEPGTVREDAPPEVREAEREE